MALLLVDNGFLSTSHGSVMSHSLQHVMLFYFTGPSQQVWDIALIYATTQHQTPNIICHNGSTPGVDYIKVTAGTEMQFQSPAWYSNHFGSMNDMNVGVVYVEVRRTVPLTGFCRTKLSTKLTKICPGRKGAAS